MRLRRAVAALLVSAFACANAEAAFDDAPFGARDAAMGGAFTAVHDEVAALAYNPAALGRAPALEVAASYMNAAHYPAGDIDRDISRAAVAAPVREELLNGAFGFDVRYDRHAQVAKDRQIGLYYGTRGLRENENGSLDLGLGLKTLQSSLETGGTTSTKPDLDLGALWRIGERRSIGASLLNFGGAKFHSGSYSDRAPLALRVGGAEAVHGSLLTADGVVREPSSGQGRSLTFAVGFERWWPTMRQGSFALRSGLSLGSISDQWDWGMGWKFGGARLDYAMGLPLTGVTRFAHAVTLAVRFGRSDPDAEYEKLLSGEMRERRRLGEQLEASALKQQALSDEIGRLRDEIAALKTAVAEKGASAEDARRRLKDLEERHKKAAETYRSLKDEAARNAAKTKAELFREDWSAYQKAKLEGAPDASLLDRVQRLLVEYKDSGADLSEASQELGRLQAR